MTGVSTKPLHSTQPPKLNYHNNRLEWVNSRTAQHPHSTEATLAVIPSLRTPRINQITHRPFDMTQVALQPMHIQRLNGQPQASSPWLAQESSKARSARQPHTTNATNNQLSKSNQRPFEHQRPRATTIMKSIGNENDSDNSDDSKKSETQAMANSFQESSPKQAFIYFQAFESLAEGAKGLVKFHSLCQQQRLTHQPVTTLESFSEMLKGLGTFYVLYFAPTSLNNVTSQALNTFLAARAISIGLHGWSKFLVICTHTKLSEHRPEMTMDALKALFEGLKGFAMLNVSQIRLLPVTVLIPLAAWVIALLLQSKATSEPTQG